MTEGKIILIDDDPTLLSLLRQVMEKAGYRVHTATNGVDGLQLVFKEHPDLIILDVMMPRMDGWETARRIRELSEVPIIMLTAKDEEADKLKGFGHGVDDYVTKPFSFAEMVARVAAVLQRVRSGEVEQLPQVLAFGDLVIDRESARVSVQRKPVNLTPTEYRLLLALADNAGRTLTHQQLLQRVWGDEYVEETGYVKRYIWYIRRKIEKDPSDPRHILTERGFGYRLEP
ncbi:MAG: response regulator transcription factor [Anaerolineae bacterium]